MITLESLLDSYAIARGVTPSTVGYYRRCLNVFQSAGGNELTADAINRFLHAKHGSNHYRKSLRTGLVALAKYAESIGLAPSLGRVARVKAPASPVRTWSSSEVSQLRECALRLTGRFHQTRQPRGRYFHAIIGGAWYLGLSQVDLHRLTLDDFRDGNLVCTRQKTGVTIRVGLPREEWELCVRIAVDGRIWPLWGSREIFARTFASIVSDAGLTGPWKTLRASAGTAYEIENPGLGHVFLGNTRDVFMRNYYDPRRERSTLPHAPTLP